MWKLIYNRYEPGRQKLREALCTLGNGYFATRGALEWEQAGGAHYPGTYLAGGYNRAKTEIADRIIENEDLVNWPNWLCLTFRPAGAEKWFSLDDVEILKFEKELDVQRGLLSLIVQFRNGAGHESMLVTRRYIHMADAHVAGIQWTLTPLNWSGGMEIQTMLDGRVRNRGVERYNQLTNRHLHRIQTTKITEDAILLEARTKQSEIIMAQAARTRVYRSHEDVNVERHTFEERGRIGQILSLDVHEKEPVRVEKMVAVYTSRDHAISHPANAAEKKVIRLHKFEEALESHEEAWERLWRRCDIDIDGAHNDAQIILRVHIFHLLQTCSLNSVDRDVGVPARGLHGEAYRGHIFWDELYIFPFLNFSLPEVTRSLLMYRHRRLDEARYLAAESGYRGAMYPWQSSSSGREESQILHLNPRSGRWIPDETHRQRHVSAAIAYNVWQYYQSTCDTEFLSFYGAEMVFEIARFWASIAEFNPERERYEIRGVVGPDEYHTRYPGAEEAGLNNNAYTNIMAAWVLRCALRIFQALPEDRREELIKALDLEQDEFELWDDMSRRMFVPFQDGGIISQFEGYDDLQEFDWEGYREKYKDIQRLDRILEAEGDDVNRYKAGKQADVLMLFYLFSSEEIGELFEHLGHEFDPESIPRNIEYYEARTSHGSTLSRLVHSWVLARSDRERSWWLFEHALRSDVEDIQGGTTAEGIHLGAMAGTVDMIQRCFPGLTPREDVLWINPALPQKMEHIHLRLRYRGAWIVLDIGQRELAVCVEKGWAESAKIGFCGKVHELSGGQERRFQIG